MSCVSGDEYLTRLGETIDSVSRVPSATPPPPPPALLSSNLLFAVQNNITGLRSWIQVEQLIPTSTVVTSTDYYAWTVGIYGDYALIGSNGDNDAGAAAGAAYVFKKTGTVWAESQKLTANDPVDWDYLGRNVWIGDLTLIIGSRYVER